MAAINYLSTDPMAGSPYQGGGQPDPYASTVFQNSGAVGVQPGGFNPNSGIMPPGQQAGGAAPQFASGMNPDQVRQAVTQFYASKGVTPNPTSIDYWTQKYGEFGNSDPNYYTQRLGQADEFTGGGGQGGGTGAFGATPPGAPWWFNTLPSASQAANTPGYQFIQQEAMNGVMGQKAAQGLLQSGSTLKDLQNRAGGIAASNYFNLANLGMNANQNNFGNAYSLSQLGLKASDSSITGRPV